MPTAPAPDKKRPSTSFGGGRGKPSGAGDSAGTGDFRVYRPVRGGNKLRGGARNSGDSESDTPAPRLVSLDAFRGLTVAGMLLVNNAALSASATPAQFIHSEGRGSDLTFADFIFPWFLLIVGVAIPFAAHGKREQTQNPWQTWLHVMERVLILLGLGMLLDSSIAHAPLPVLGVLQIIGLAYGVARILYALTPSPLLRGTIVAVLLGIYGASLTGGAWNEHSYTSSWNETHNWVARWNSAHPYPAFLRGLPSVWPTASMALLGTLIGDLLRKNTLPVWVRLFIMAVVSTFLMIVGYAWSDALPMNKAYWTSSYLLYTAGWGIALLGAFYLLIDAGNFRSLQTVRSVLAYPFVVFGANPLIAYAGAILFKLHVLQEWAVWQNGHSVSLQQAALNGLSDLLGRTPGGWVYTIGYIAVWWVVCAVLYHKRIFLRA